MLTLTFIVEFMIGALEVAVSAAREMMDFSEKGAKSAPRHHSWREDTHYLQVEYLLWT